MNLTIRQLQTFKEVMLSGSMSEAGRTLGRTQPAISAMLASLEDQLGYKLFTREHKRLIPRPEAHYFLEEAEHVLTRLAQSARTMRDIGNLERGTLKIACNPAAAEVLAPRTLAKFVKNRDDVRASLMMRSSIIVEEWIASQQYDVGIAERPQPRGTVNIEPFEMTGVCILRNDDPLASKQVITPSDLDGKPMALLFEEHPTRAATENVFREFGATCNRRFELRTFLPAFELAEQGLCNIISDPISAVAYEAQRGNACQLVFKPFFPVVPYDMALLTPAHRPSSKLATEFIELITIEMNKIVERFPPARNPA